MVQRATQGQEELTTDTVRQLQEAAGAYEQNVWSRQGARQDHHGIWRSHTGKTVGPAKLLRSILREEHEKAHGGWKSVTKSVEKAWWHPHMLDMSRETSESCEVCKQYNNKVALQLSEGKEVDILHRLCLCTWDCNTLRTTVDEEKICDQAQMSPSNTRWK
ncbi:unnamed protein product [Coregonus sp. 'balchen']|nr:unnamed protein product [Coregonus sp. 'balchen']